MDSDAALLSPREAAWLLASVAVAVLPLAPQLPQWLPPLLVLLLAWRAVLLWRAAALAPRWLVMLVLLAVAGSIAIHYHTLFGPDPGVALLALLAAMKPMESRRRRDAWVIIMLCLVLIMGRYFDAQSLDIAIISLVGVLTVLLTLAIIAGGDGVLPSLRLVLLLLLQALPVMLVMFVLFPRIASPLWQLPTSASSGIVGLDDRMSPGSISDLIQSEEIAFRVSFDGASPPREEMYWRGPVLSTQIGDEWLPAGLNYIAAPRYQQRQGAPVHDYEITLEPHNRRWLFVLDYLGEEPGNNLRSNDFQLLASTPISERRRYKASSWSRVDFLPEKQATLNKALQTLPGRNPRSTQLGRQWAATGESPQQRLQRAIAFLREQNLTYTLKPPLMRRDVADAFLFEHKAGFCEHFAAAFVVLMRAAAVPARVVTGYLGGEYNRFDASWVIRQSDAHAWAEVWLPQEGWVRVDPTAIAQPRRLDSNLADAVADRASLPLLNRLDIDLLLDLRLRWWAANNVWNQWVLGFNAQRQLDLLSRLGMPQPNWGKMTMLLGVLGGVMLTGLALILAWRRPRLDAGERQWRRLSRRLAKRGLQRQPWEAPLLYAQRLQRQAPDLAEDIAAIAALYTGLRYADDGDAAKLRRRVNSIKI